MSNNNTLTIVVNKKYKKDKYGNRVRDYNTIGVINGDTRGLSRSTLNNIVSRYRRHRKGVVHLRIERSNNQENNKQGVTIKEHELIERKKQEESNPFIKIERQRTSPAIRQALIEREARPVTLSNTRIETRNGQQYRVTETSLTGYHDYQKRQSIGYKQAFQSKDFQRNPERYGYSVTNIERVGEDEKGNGLYKYTYTSKEPALRQTRITIEKQNKAIDKNLYAERYLHERIGKGSDIERTSKTALDLAMNPRGVSSTARISGNILYGTITNQDKYLVRGVEELGEAWHQTRKIRQGTTKQKIVATLHTPIVQLPLMYGAGEITGIGGGAISKARYVTGTGRIINIGSGIEKAVGITSATLFTGTEIHRASKMIKNKEYGELTGEILEKGVTLPLAITGYKQGRKRIINYIESKGISDYWLMRKGKGVSIVPHREIREPIDITTEGLTRDMGKDRAMGKGEIRITKRWTQQEIGRGRYDALITNKNELFPETRAVIKGEVMINNKEVPFLETQRDISLHDTNSYLSSSRTITLNNAQRAVEVGDIVRKRGITISMGEGVINNDKYSISIATTRQKGELAITKMKTLLGPLTLRDIEAPRPSTGLSRTSMDMKGFSETTSNKGTMINSKGNQLLIQESVINKVSSILTITKPEAKTSTGIEKLSGTSLLLSKKRRVKTKQEQRIRVMNPTIIKTKQETTPLMIQELLIKPKQLITTKTRQEPLITTIPAQRIIQQQEIIPSMKPPATTTPSIPSIDMINPTTRATLFPGIGLPVLSTSGGKPRRISSWRKLSIAKYTPTLTALIGKKYKKINIKKATREIYTGFEERPIPKKWKPRRKKHKKRRTR